MIICMFRHPGICYGTRLQTNSTSERYDGSTEEILSKRNMHSYSANQHRFERYYITTQGWLSHDMLQFEGGGNIPPLLIAYNNNFNYICDII